MPPDGQGEVPSVDGFILVRSSQGHTWLSTNEPLTRRRVELVKMLVGNAQWIRHSNRRAVKWRAVR